MKNCKQVVNQWTFQRTAKELLTHRPRLKSSICSILLTCHPFSFPFYCFHILLFSSHTLPSQSLFHGFHLFLPPSLSWSVFFFSFSLQSYLVTQSLTLTYWGKFRKFAKFWYKINYSLWLENVQAWIGL